MKLLAYILSAFCRYSCLGLGGGSEFRLNCKIRLLPTRKSKKAGVYIAPVSINVHTLSQSTASPGTELHQGLVGCMGLTVMEEMAGTLVG